MGDRTLLLNADKPRPCGEDRVTALSAGRLFGPGLAIRMRGVGAAQGFSSRFAPLEIWRQSSSLLLAARDGEIFRRV
jgi:hypothetical protein